MIRRLYLGSVSSLSFEEEENEFCQARERRKSMGSIEDSRRNGDGAEEDGLNMELHEMLTDRLYEQVSYRVDIDKKRHYEQDEIFLNIKCKYV